MLGYKDDEIDGKMGTAWHLFADHEFIVPAVNLMEKNHGVIRKKQKW